MIDYEAPSLESGVPTLWPPCWCQTRDMRLIRLDGLNRGTIWDGQSSSPDQLGITAPTSGPTIATPTGGNATEGTYYCAIRYKDATHGTYSELSDLTSVSAATDDKFSWSGIAVSTESRVTHIELWRSTCDQNRKLYLITTLANSGTPSYSDDTSSDDTLGVLASSSQLSIYAADNKTLVARKQGVPPNFMRVVQMFQDRAFYGVPAIYRAGTVTLANGSDTATGTDTAWTSGSSSPMIGRKLYVVGAGKGYEIKSVASATSITLTEDSEDTVTAGAYAIMPDPATYNNLLLFSETDEPESVPPTQNTVVVQENTDDNDWITGLMPHGSVLWVLKQRHVYALTFIRQPSIDVAVNLRFSRGCLNQRCWGFYEDVAFLMDAAGPWSITATGGFEPIGDPIRNTWRDAGLDFGKSDWWFVEVDAVQQIVRFWVTLVGQTGARPKTAFVFNLRTKAWNLEDYEEMFSGSCRVEHLGRVRTLVGGQYDRLVLLGDGWSDGVSAQGSVTAATSTTLSDSTQTFTDEMVGYEVTIVRGTGAGQVREILTKASATQVTVAAWETTPDTTSRYALHYAIRSTATSATSTTLVDTAVTFSTRLAGATVAILSGTGAGQLRVIKTADTNTLTITSAWTTTPSTDSVYLVGAVEATYLTGLVEVVAEERRTGRDAPGDERGVGLVYKPTTGEQTLDMRLYLDHETTPETLGADWSEGALAATKGEIDLPLNLKRTRSALANAPGQKTLNFRMRSTERQSSHHWYAVGLHWFQAQEEVAIYSLEQR